MRHKKAKSFCMSPRWFLFRMHLVPLAIGLAVVQPCPAEQPADRAAAYSRHVKPLIEAHCVRCHGADDPEGGISLHNLRAAGAAPTELTTWKKVFERLEDGTMPPKNKKQPLPGDRQVATAWIKAALTAGGVAFDEYRLLRPERGNWVDHDALFSGKQIGEASTPGRIWRLSPRGYSTLMRRIAEQCRARVPARARGEALLDFEHANDPDSPWELPSQWNFADYSTAHRVGEAEIEFHMRLCQKIVDTCNLSQLTLGTVVTAGKAATPAQVKAAAVEIFDKILQVPADPEDLQRYSDFLSAQLLDYEPREAAGRFLLAALCRPEVMYRIEEAAGGVDRAMMSPRQLARTLAYTLTDREPDPKLAAAAAEGHLASPDDVRAQVERILSDPAIPKPRPVAFFREYFGYGVAPSVFKCFATVEENKVKTDRKAYSNTAPALVGDLDALVRSVVDDDTQVLKTLLTTNQWFVGYGAYFGYFKQRERILAQKARAAETAASQGKPFDGNAKAYQIAPPAPLPEFLLQPYGLSVGPDLTKAVRAERYDMPAGQRMGILTHPAWLVAQSSNFDNHAIHRGRWIREKLLGGKIPDVPIGVDAKLPDEPQTPLRARMTKTREDYCWKCHRLMDPLGLTFEQFDHFGRYREEELVVDKEKTDTDRAKNPNAKRTMKNVPLDTSGAIGESGDSKLDGPVKGPFELISRLAESERVEQVFVRHVFRYFLGRNETLADGSTLIAAHKAYRDNHGSMKALLASLLSSQAFLERSSAPAPAAGSPGVAAPHGARASSK
jgi:mono/diheme cytochrome c family protein